MVLEFLFFFVLVVDNVYEFGLLLLLLGVSFERQVLSHLGSRPWDHLQSRTVGATDYVRVFFALQRRCLLNVILIEIPQSRNTWLRTSINFILYLILQDFDMLSTARISFLTPIMNRRHLFHVQVPDPKLGFIVTIFNFFNREIRVVSLVLRSVVNFL